MSPPQSPLYGDALLTNMLLGPSKGLLTAAEFITKLQSSSSSVLSTPQLAPVSCKPVKSLAEAILSQNVKETSDMLVGIIALQARVRGYIVRRRVLLSKKVSNASAKIQAAYRRYRVLKWIHNDDSTNSEYSFELDMHISGGMSADVDKSLMVMDNLLGFQSPEEKEASSAVVPLPDTPVVTRAITSASPDSAVIIKAMQLEIKRLQRMISRQGPFIPVDSPS